MKQPLPSYIRAGITGFGSTPQPIDPKDLKDFRALCYTAARAADAIILGFDLSLFNVIRNFVFALLKFPKDPGVPLAFVFLNQHVPLLAFVSAHDQAFYPPLAFIDVFELTVPFERSYHVLKKQELELPWIWSQRELASSLYPEEIEQIKYWKPQSVGEVLFNFWD